MQKLFALILFSLIISPAVYAADYTVDPDHTAITFKVRHMGISYVAGTFDKFEGSFSFDAKDIKDSKAQATISANSVNTKNQKRDDHLRSPEFLNAEKNSQITFKSQEIFEIKENNFKVRGELTINGVAKEVVLDAQFQGEVKDPWGNERAAFNATTTINRKDFGLLWNKLLETGGLVVGEDVNIAIEVEGIKKK